MKKIIHLAFVAILISSSIAHCWQWPWVDNTELINKLAEKYEEDVMQKTLNDYLRANRRKIEQYPDVLPSSYGVFGNRMPIESFRELHRRTRIESELKKDGLSIIEKALKNRSGLGIEDEEYISEAHRRNSNEFEEKLVKEYGKSNVADYWYDIQKTYWEKYDNKKKDTTTPQPLYSPLEEQKPSIWKTTTPGTYAGSKFTGGSELLDRLKQW